jgi:hypothetical protein
MGISMRKCVYCESELEGKRRKFCNDHCQYRYNSIKNDKGSGRFRHAQFIRMVRAGRAQRQGRVGCRYN